MFKKLKYWWFKWWVIRTSEKKDRSSKYYPFIGYRYKIYGTETIGVLKIADAVDYEYPFRLGNWKVKINGDCVHSYNKRKAFIIKLTPKKCLTQ
jgi:hypothetical protein